MLYLVLKSIHVAAVIVWMSGMIFAPAALARMQAGGGVTRPQAEALFNVFRILVSPAILIAWLIGLWLAWDAGYFRDGWLHGKLALAFLVSGLHGVVSGQLRKLAAGTIRRPSALVLNMHWIVIVSVALIALLVIVKPF